VRLPHAGPMAGARGGEKKLGDALSQELQALRVGYEADESWSTWRIWSASVLRATWFRTLLCTVVIANMVIVVLETNHIAATGEPEGWQVVADYCLLTFYSVEVLARIFVLRQHFVSDHWNTMDLSLVTLDVVSEVLKGSVNIPSFTFLRIFRLMSMLTSVKVLIWCPELHLLVTSMVGAMRSIFWGTLVVSLWLMVWSIMAVIFIHPLVKELSGATDAYDGCDRCPRAFESVQAAFLTFTQTLIAGDSWGTTALPLIDAYPATMAFFLGAIATVQMGLLNLVLAVTVDSAQISRHAGDVELEEVKKRERKELHGHMKEIFKHLDEDGSGLLTLPEIMKGMDEPMFKKAMQAMAIGPEDMEMVFKLIDGDHSGTIGYEEFSDQLDKMKQDDMQTIITFVRFYCSEISHQLKEETKILKTEIVDRLCDIESYIGGPNGAKKAEAKRGSPAAGLLNGSPAAAVLNRCAAPQPQPLLGKSVAGDPGRPAANPSVQFLKTELEKLTRLQETIPRDQVKQLLKKLEEVESKAVREAAAESTRKMPRAGGDDAFGCCSVSGGGADRERVRA